MPIKDPRSFIKIAALPLDSQRGFKIQARSFLVYSTAEPSREEVRMRNFQRRSAQFSSQGYQSVKHKAYCGIGDPFYLDEKKLMLHSLGQLNESSASDLESSSYQEDVSGSSNLTSRGRMTTANFVLRRKRKDLSTLSKEVVKGRQLVQNVRLGQGLFDLLHQQKSVKLLAARVERERKLEDAHGMWNLLQSDSDSHSESDGDLTSKDDRQSRSRQGSRTVRPYTPCHSNLVRLQQDATGKCSLDVGGTRVSMSKVHQDKLMETKWDRFVNLTSTAKTEKQSSVIPRRDKPHLLPRSSRPSTSLQSTSPSITSASSLNVLSGSTAGRACHRVNSTHNGDLFPGGIGSAAGESSLSASGNNRIDEGMVKRHDGERELEENGDNAFCKSMFEYLDEYYDSLRKDRDEEEVVKGTPDEQMIRKSQFCGMEVRRKDGKRCDSAGKSISSRQPPTSRGVTRYVRGRSLAEEKKTQVVTAIAYSDSHSIKFLDSTVCQEAGLSKKYTSLSLNYANRMEEMKDESLITLHEILEQIDRERLSTCKLKYMSLSMEPTDLHSALRTMRRGSGRGTRQTSAGYRHHTMSPTEHDWFIALCDIIPQSVKDVWYLQVVIEKLRKHGQTGNSSKQSVYKFLKVLEQLRAWEICSPDVSAAIEFCREWVVGLPVDEYEEWFKSTFPAIRRPHTAPPDVRKKHSSRKEVQSATSA